jgi:hypothetical protein
MKAIIAAAALGAALIAGSAGPAPAMGKNTMMGPGACAGTVLAAVRGSGESGCASTRGGNGVIFLGIAVKGEPPGGNQPSHIHKGKCGSNGPIVIPLKNVVGGHSATSIPMAKWRMVNHGGYYINIHKSVTDLATIVSCGDIKAMAM